MTPAFSDYPTGRAGFGLAILRAALIAEMIDIAVQPPQQATIVIVVTGTLSLLIAAGCLIRLVSLLAMISVGLMLRTSSGCDPLLIAGVALTAGALGLLGAGAYSVDARLFGRRVIAIAARPEPARSSDDEFP